MKKRIDLHIHTNCSDGVLSPKQVIDEAVRNGINIISITDHDTINAYNEELYNYAKSKGVQLICGVEISTKVDKAGIHVLGYDIDVNNKELNQALFMLRNSRHKYLHDVSSKLESLDYIINTQELDKIDAVAKSHIASNVVNNKKNAEILLKNFGYIPNRGEFIETVMNEGCEAYVKKHTITPKQAAELIRRAGGKVILAHPVAYKYEDNLSDEDILKIVKEMNADGIEANYIYITRDNKRVNESSKWNEFAKKNNLIVTTGSDFHNKDGIHPEIGLLDPKENDIEK